MPMTKDRRFRLLLLVGGAFLLTGAILVVARQLWANHLYAQAVTALEGYDFDQAGEKLAAYLAYRPSDGATWLLAAQTARRRKDWKAADRLLDQAREQGANPQEIGVERQLTVIHLGGQASQLQQLRAYCEKEPKSPSAGIALEAIIEGGLTSFQLPQAKWGIDLWLQHRTSGRAQARGLLWQGQILEFTQKFPEALAGYQKAVELAPDYLPAHLRLTEALLRDQPEQARQEGKWLAQHAPDHPESLLLQARLMRSLGQPEAALPLLDRLLVSDPKRVDALLERGRVLMDLQKPSEGVRYLRQAQELAPQRRETNLALSDCLRLLNQLEEARQYLDRVGKIDQELEKRLREFENRPR